MSEEKRLDTAANEQPKKKTKEQLYIDEAAKAGAREVLHLQHKVFTINYYRATEDALRAYIKVKRQLEHPEEYGFFPTGKSHDISVAPPPGLGLRDKVEANELYVESRKNSFIRTADKFNEIHMAVKAFENRREFVVIRMYYFGEDEYAARMAIQPGPGDGSDDPRRGRRCLHQHQRELTADEARKEW